MENNIEEIITAIKESQPLSRDGLGIDLFRDIYNRFKAIEDEYKVLWLLVFIGDQIIIQPLGNPYITIIVRESRPSFYSLKDVSFLNADDFAYFGTFNGNYSVASFLKDLITPKGAFVLLTTFFLSTFSLYFYASTDVMKTISEALMNSMAIFVSIFVLFVLTIDSDLYYRFSESDRLHKLMQSDKYICIISVAALLFAIISQIFSSAISTNIPASFEVYDPIRLAQSIILSLSCSASLFSFWLVIFYHFERRNQLIEITMARKILEYQQTLSDKVLTEGNCYS